MSNLFGNLADQQKGAEKEKDVLGGRRKLFATDVYPAKVEVVYVTKSDGGASALNFVFKVGEQVHRETVYITSKKGESFYMTKDDKKAPLPGYALANALTKLAIGKEIPALVFEDQIVKN
jgi:predicted Zn-dependent protease